jgi:soluble lytic murein transglycosylase
VAPDIRRLNRDLQADAWRLPSNIERTMTTVRALTVVLALAMAAAPALAVNAKLEPSAKEVAHFKTFDAAISGVRGYDLPVDEATRIRDAMKALAAQDIFKALEIKGGIKDSVGLKLIAWYRLRGGYGQLAEYKTWLDENPAWPDRGIMNQRYEELLFTEGGTPANVIEQFKKVPPRNGIGHAALAAAELATGDTEGAKARAVKAWREMTIPANLESAFIEKLGKFLSAADHKWRLDRLLMDDIRWAPDRAERASAIRRQIARLPQSETKKAEARLAVFVKAEDARYLMAGAVAKEDIAGDTGFLYHRIQNLRRINKAQDAIALMQKAPIDPKLTPNLDEWWAERRILAYAALNSGNAKLAYDLVKDAGPLGVNPSKEQGFMAGWLALRFLKDEKAAVTHFTAAAKAADGPLSRARAGYWLGRIAEGQGNKDKAREHYSQAAREIDTFYGQLAQLKLDPKNRRIEIKMPAPPTADQIKRFNELDAVKAVVVARKSGLEPAVSRLLLSHLKTYLDGETESALVAHLAGAIGDTQIALRIAKTGVARGQNMLVYAYPLHTFPSFTPLRTPPETALLLGVTRQETEFNKDTVSGAGAKGLMQVMTVTANHVCKDYKIKCELDRLLPDPAYNATIASAYIADRMSELGGSYALGMAAFNAGPGRTREWIRAFGDPRDGKQDPIDWIERIPFQETREYVAKVLSNIQIYRARLGNEDGALQLDIDLVRGRGKTSLPAPEAAAGSAGPDG